jgi:hypothetical protein
LCLLLVASSLALVACDEPPIEDEVVGPAPEATPYCGVAESGFSGPFNVYPQTAGGDDGEACLQPAVSWEQLVGEGLAGWGYGVGTFLGDGAVVFLPDDEGEISMQVNTEIQLPNASGGDLSLIMGTIAIYWQKTVGNIGAIVSGGVVIDPDFVVMEVSTDPEQQTTSIDVYAGEIIVTVTATGEDVEVKTGQSAFFALDEEPLLEDLSGQNPPEIDRLLEVWGDREVEIPEGLDFALGPNFGEVQLVTGFLPDPLTIDVISGGDIDVRAMNYGNDCAGYATSAPDYRVYWSGEADIVYVYFLAEEEGQDTTLVINDPGGNWICNDDYSGRNPLVKLEAPMTGQYDIWVGSYSSGEIITGRLYVTEIEPEF